tara:strand:+ start:211 stop:930 length:720 start_codon:yes stop_codon:yes gene_type:complete
MRALTESIVLITFFISMSLTGQHKILDSSKVYDHWDTKILKNYEVGNVQIRHVQINNATWCAIHKKDEIIEISGPINEDVPVIIERLLKKLSKKSGCQKKKIEGLSHYPIEIYLNSGGGYLEDGFKLGEIFREYGVRTKIPQGSVCYSSCATAFLGGIKRHMDKGSKIGFHAPYTFEYAIGNKITCEKENIELKKYYIKMANNNASEILYDRTMSYCGIDTGWILNHDAAEIFEIANSS